MDWPEVGKGNCKGIWHDIVVACGRTDLPYHLFTWTSQTAMSMPMFVEIHTVISYGRHVTIGIFDAYSILSASL